MNYGLPYKGSKNRLAERIVELLPPRKHFYDLFCGGCAVTHAAMMTRKWEDFTINDLNWQCPTLFIDALNGKYKDDTRWISREDFFRLKDSDPYVAFVWSFGNNLRNYLYNKDIEPLKRAIHYALYFDDYQPLKELGHDLSCLAQYDTIEQKYAVIRKYFKQFGHFQQQSHEGAEYAHYQQIGGVQRVQHSEANQRLGAISDLTRCRTWKQQAESTDLLKKKKEPLRLRAPRAQEKGVTDNNIRNASDASRIHVGGGKISLFTDDYANIHIEPNSVIYCDIPYEGTDSYQKGGFDFERFYDWCFRQTEPVFISSYKMPSDFEEVAVFSHTCSLSRTKTNKVVEKLFVPKSQTTRLYHRQLLLDL